ncbi:MAG TPA: pilus assembly protein TadG-related protein [Beijerinckiaceae bacterium]|nr:pilus assembly protein TadG-related protein [Beijerinckiaceae bacterium]
MSLQFISDRRGNVAMIFAIALPMLLGLVGAAIEYGRSADAHSKLQAATDAAALAAARQPRSMPPAEFTTKARQVFDTMLPPGGGITTTEFTASRSGNAIEVKAKASFATSLIQPLGFSNVDLASESRSQSGSRNVEVVLALDNTGSMASNNKMPELKKAAKRLVDILEQSVTQPGQVKIGLVPFATSVRVNPASGAGYRTATWIDFTRGDGSATVCSQAGGNWGWLLGQICVDHSNNDVNKSTWQGCIEDRASPNNATDARVETGNLATMYPALQNCRQDENHLVFVQPLSTAYSSLRTAIDNMTPGGNTNVTIGVAWGLSLLSRQDPFPEGVAYTDKEVAKFLIVLTDGQNTQDRFDNCGGTQSCIARMNARTLAACDAAKNAVTDPNLNRITVYTIRVIDGDADLLRRCASDPSKFFDVKNAGQLEPVFMGIGDSIASLRLTH